MPPCGHTSLPEKGIPYQKGACIFCYNYVNRYEEFKHIYEKAPKVKPTGKIYNNCGCKKGIRDVGERRNVKGI